MQESTDYQYLDRLVYWINERWAIYQRKERGEEAPWTRDTILSRYRFCNVHRENDRVTKWIAKHWRDPNVDHSALWFNMLIARMLNWPPTLQRLGYIEHWDPIWVRNKLKRWRDDGNKVFTGAYTISTNGKRMDKIDYLVDCVWNEAWRVGYGMGAVEPLNCGTLSQAHDQLTNMYGVASFLAAQVVADLKHTPQLGVEQVDDWWNWCAPGPGSQRGLNRLLGHELGTTYGSEVFIHHLLDLREALEPSIEFVPEICLQDLQNCLCEFDKYMRLLAGGKVRSTYKPHTYPI